MNKKSMKQKTDHYQGKTPEICTFHQSELQKFTKKKRGGRTESNLQHLP
jgi:hypothetical protein